MALAFFSRLQGNNQLRYLYAIRLLRELVNKLLVFFLPLYFFTLRIPFFDQFHLSPIQQGILLVVLAYFIDELSSLISAIPVAQLHLKFGIQHGFLMGQLLYAIFVLLLFASQTQPALIFVAMAVDGIQMSFFWNSYHYALTRQTNIHRMGKNLGVMNFLLNLLAMIAPALGGLIIVMLGYSTLFLLGLVVILLAVVFSLLFQEMKVKDHVSWKEFLSWLQEPGFRRLAVTFAGRYMNDAIITVWPLYIYLLWGTTEGVGLLYTISLILAMLLSFAFGPMLDRKQASRKPYFVSGAFLSLIWFARMFVLHVWTIAVVDTLDRLTASYHWLFFDRSWLLRGKGNQALSFFVYRQTINAAVGMVFWLMVLIVFLSIGHAWQVLFILAGCGVLLTLLIQQQKMVSERS